MAKRHKRKRDPYIDPLMLELTKEYADHAPWISWTDEDGPEAPWYVALAKLDKTKDKTPLLDLLNSGQEPTPAIRGHIADLLNRYTLKRKRGKQATPSYVLSGPNIRLWWLIWFMNGGMKKSIEEAAEEYATDEFPAETLIAAYQGRHGGYSRALKKVKK